MFLCLVILQIAWILDTAPFFRSFMFTICLILIFFWSFKLNTDPSSYDSVILHIIVLKSMIFAEFT